MVSEWQVKRERDRMSHHYWWVVRFRGRRVKRSATWRGALDHVCSYHRKFGVSR